VSGGIILFGPSGSGTTTIGRELAKQLNYPHFDLDDFHWYWDTEIPYTVLRSNEERISLITDAVHGYENFVMSGSMWSIRKSFEPMFDLAVYVVASAIVRAERLRARSISRWGNRVLEGGDIFEHHEVYRDYFAAAQSYDNDESSQSYRKQHEQWIKELACPVLRVDGENNIQENVTQILEQYMPIKAVKNILN
jgi:adenylate kinase family enzyme